MQFFLLRLDWIWTLEKDNLADLAHFLYWVLKMEPTINFELLSPVICKAEITEGTNNGSL